MTYAEFLKNIKDYVKKTVEMTYEICGEIHTAQRYVWDEEEFAPESKDSLVKVLSVKEVA